jgi:hypothetical protein
MHTHAYTPMHTYPMLLSSRTWSMWGSSSSQVCFFHFYIIIQYNGLHYDISTHAFNVLWSYLLPISSPCPCTLSLAQWNSPPLGLCLFVCLFVCVHGSVFCIWEKSCHVFVFESLIPLNMLIYRSIFLRITISFFLNDTSCVYIYHILLIHSSVDWQVARFRNWAFVNELYLSKHECSFLSYANLHFLGCMLRSSVAGPYGSSICKFLMNLLIDFQVAALV